MSVGRLKNTCGIPITMSLYSVLSCFKQPHTAFTFDILDYYFIDSLECKTPAMSFCQKITRLTDNAFPSEVKVSGRNFCKIV